MRLQGASARDVARRLLPLVSDEGWFFDTELLLLAERNGLRIHEVPVDWVEDLDSRVDLVGRRSPATCAASSRVRRAFWSGDGTRRGRLRQPVAASMSAIVARAEPADAHRGSPRRRPRGMRVALSGILALSAFLNLYKLTQNGYANTYYAAAVRSMLLSWHNFFFASFDPGGLVSVDKPPLALWVEAASREALRLLELRRSCCPRRSRASRAVWLLYLLVARYFGRVAGLVAALALAVSPVSVAVNRDNNPDALFVLLLVAAAYAGARAIESGRLRTLLGAAALAGLAFETKMLAAAIVVPGHRARLPRLRARAVAARASSTPRCATACSSPSRAPGSRPSQLTPGCRPAVRRLDERQQRAVLALGYNGLGRVTGQTGGTSTGGGGGGAFSGTPGWLPADQQRARRSGRLAAAARASSAASPSLGALVARATAAGSAPSR